MKKQQKQKQKHIQPQNIALFLDDRWLVLIYIGEIKLLYIIKKINLAIFLWI